MTDQTDSEWLRATVKAEPHAYSWRPLGGWAGAGDEYDDRLLQIADRIEDFETRLHNQGVTIKEIVYKLWNLKRERDECVALLEVCRDDVYKDDRLAQTIDALLARIKGGNDD